MARRQLGILLASGLIIAMARWISLGPAPSTGEPKELAAGSEVGSTAIEQPGNGSAGAGPINIDSPTRCGCKLTDATSYEQPDACVLKARPNLVGLDGYLKADPTPAEHPQTPWLVNELKQTGPEVWDPHPSKMLARTKVHVLRAVFTSEFSPLQGRLQVQDASGRGGPFWIRIEDFDPVAWWTCPADKAVVHSLIVAQPRASIRPTTIEGRWIDTTYKGPVWCWTWVENVGVYCEPRIATKSRSFDPWIYKPGDLTIVY